MQAATVVVETGCTQYVHIKYFSKQFMKNHKSQLYGAFRKSDVLSSILGPPAADLPDYLAAI